MEVWIGRDGERHGPYTEVEVRQWLQSGQLSANDLGWYEGMADWAPLSTLFPDALAGRGAAAEAAIPPLPASIAATAPPAAVATLDYASFWQRFGAWVIDLVVLLIPGAIASYAMGGMAAFEHLLAQMQAAPDSMSTAMMEYAQATRGINLAVTVIGFLYYSLFEASPWQATPGKLALRLRVTGDDGQKLGIGRAMLRNLVRLANLITGLIPFICYIAIAWTQRKQGLHDLMARTLVLNGSVREQAPARQPGPRDNSFNA